MRKNREKGCMMQVEEIEVSKQEIESELNELQLALDKGYITIKNKLVQDLLQIYGHLKLGGTIIDINATFQKTGLDPNDDPRLAIVRADAKCCYLYKKQNGSAIFSRESKQGWNIYPKKAEGDIVLPAGTFQWKDMDNKARKTLVPFIPPRVNLVISTRIMPHHYYILFEPVSWAKYEPRPPRDPILGRMLTANLFGVLATWNLTDLEAKIIEGRI